MKLCSKCNKLQDVICFGKRASSKDGLKSQCKSCDQLYSQNMNREKRNKRQSISRKQRIKELQLKMLIFLSDKKCAHCPENDPIVMEFDHLDASLKEISISEAIVRCFSWERIQAEIDKCQILCANCHRRKTAKDFGFYKTK